jgi:hypothetical protein
MDRNILAMLEALETVTVNLEIEYQDLYFDLSNLEVPKHNPIYRRIDRIRITKEFTAAAAFLLREEVESGLYAKA